MIANSWMEVVSPALSCFSNSNSIHGKRKNGNWTQQENKLFENALAYFDEDTPDRWEKVAEMIPGKTVADVLTHYQDLEEDVSCIEAGLIPFPVYSSSSFTLDWENDHGLEGWKAAYAVGGKRSGCRLADHERKKGIPWTEEEHKRFLMGLKKYGKGDWRNISRNFVVTRTPTQVASHAQKYFIRLNSGGKDKRRASIHDITTVNLVDDRSPSPSQPSAVTTQSCSEQFSMTIDSDQPNEAASFFRPSTGGNHLIRSPYAILPYAATPHARTPHHGGLHATAMQNGASF